MSYAQGGYHPTLLTGDFNATTQSELHHLITQGTESNRSSRCVFDRRKQANVSESYVNLSL
jgi:endonuclease/exonuclease/phosphatase family metal-dependent hydrolase